MAVAYILAQAGVKMGLDPQVAGDRAVLLRYLNEAANELYDQSDMDGVLYEQVFQVNGDQQIALPPHVGPLRALREYSTHVPWHLTNQRLRYNQFNWKDRWRNFRLKGFSPLMYPIANQSLVTVITPTVEIPNVVVTITGSTTTASSISEDVVLSAAGSITPINVTEGVPPSLNIVGGLTTKNQFNDIYAIKKSVVNNFDIILVDADGNMLSVVPNNMLQAKYRLIDVSLYPWSNTDTATSDHIMEILFKKALPWFQNDEDEFPALGYDNIIVNKILQLWNEEEGKIQEAQAYDAKATRSLARKHEDANRGVEEEAALVENSHDTLLPRNRPLGPARYQGQIYY